MRSKESRRRAVMCVSGVWLVSFGEIVILIILIIIIIILPVAEDSQER